MTAKYNPRTTSSDIFLSGHPIGNLVSFGKRDARSVSRTGLPRTVYAAGAAFGGRHFREEGATVASALNKLAKAITPFTRPEDLESDVGDVGDEIGMRP